MCFPHSPREKLLFLIQQKEIRQHSRAFPRKDWFLQASDFTLLKCISLKCMSHICNILFLAVFQYSEMQEGHNQKKKRTHPHTHTHVHYSRHSSQEMVMLLLTHWHKSRKEYSLLPLFTCAYAVSACHNSSPFTYRMPCLFLICNTNIFKYSNAERIEFTSTKTLVFILYRGD